MASAAFRSSTKRFAPGGGGRDVEDAGSSTRGSSDRRSRSLSCHPGRIRPWPPESGEFPAASGELGNKAGFREVNLDDLADEFFRWRGEETEAELRPAVTGRRNAGVSPRGAGDLGRRRGRSVSRHHGRTAGEKKGVFENSGSAKGVSNGRNRRLRSLSVARCQYSDSESFCSALTDDEAQNGLTHRNATKKTLQAVHVERKEFHPRRDDGGTRLYEAMQKEVRNAVKEIKKELENVMLKAELTSSAHGNNSLSNGSDVIHAITDIRKSYTKKLEESKKRRQELLAELAVEEQHGHEITMIVRELLHTPIQPTVVQRPSWPVRRSNDGTRMSKHLTEEAEKYIEEFLSNVEDTDISSFDGERSETSSMVGGSAKLRDSITHNSIAESNESLTGAASLPLESDGVALPWLQWETNNDGSLLSCHCKTCLPTVLADSSVSAVQGANSACDHTNYLKSSLGSCTPEVTSSCPMVLKANVDSISGAGSVLSGLNRLTDSSFDLVEYAHLCEDHLFERFRQKQRIDSGGLILCGRF